VKYVDEFRNESIARKLAAQMRKAATRPWKIMEVCGGQTHTILRYGIEDLLPPGIDLLHGPGCPVCVTPLEVIDKAIMIARKDQTILCSFGDMLRVPGSHDDLLQAKAQGADVRIVYSPLDALKLAQSNPDRSVVFFGVGFETTAPANAMTVYQARQLGINNFFLLCSHVTVPPIMSAILELPDNRIQAFLGPGHVCSVVGTKDYETISQKYSVPIVITGFEPLDILEGILLCIMQLENGDAHMENQYSRAVLSEGNQHAYNIIKQVFCVSDRTWRGIGTVAASGYKLSDEYQQYDAELHFAVDVISAEESSLCISGEVLRGLKKPQQCSAFGKECTPEHPLGAPMVSAEGTCASYYKFGKVTQVGMRG
jgi:hydrogenase expression/formation protein HypD